MRVHARASPRVARAYNSPRGLAELPHHALEPRPRSDRDGVSLGARGPVPNLLVPALRVRPATGARARGGAGSGARILRALHREARLARRAGARALSFVPAGGDAQLPRERARSRARAQTRR